MHIEAVSSLEAGHELTCCASRILEAKVVDVCCLELNFCAEATTTWAWMKIGHIGIMTDF